MKKRLRPFLFSSLFALASGIYGIGVGKYEWPPHNLLQDAKARFEISLGVLRLGKKNPKDRESGYFSELFSDPLRSDFFVFPELNDLGDIREFNTKFFIESDSFFNAYSNLQIREVSEIKSPSGLADLSKVIFTIDDRVHEAFAYFRPVRHITPPADSCAALLIPGTGNNQATAIVSGDKSNYHFGVLRIFEGRCDLFVLIKPNEDVLAGYHGDRKLSYNAITNWHLNHGGSYSASYIIRALAFQKQLEKRYGKTVVAGLSQGGLATLLVALQSEPDLAIVASGYSTLLQVADDSGPQQIVIPGVGEALDGRNLVEALSRSSTQFVFSWGALERGIYGQEARDHVTCKFLERHQIAPTCMFFQGGHEFAIKPLISFLERRAHDFNTGTKAPIH